MTQVIIEPRFNGPPDSGNGGYCAGLIAGAIGEPVRVRLAQPVPLNVAMHVVPNAAGGWDVRADLPAPDTLIATAIAHVPQVDVPPAPSFVEALGVSQHFTGFAQHRLPTCFVCGPQRVEGDGLRIFPGLVPGTNVLAAPWQPDSSVVHADGSVRPEFIWAVLDCPGYFASCSPAAALLGELSIDIERRPRLGEACIVTAWPIAAQGRKFTAGTALFDAQGQRCAIGIATWIALKSDAAN